MVIDAQLFNQPDAVYYGKQVDLDSLSFKVLASAEKPGIWLTGPRQWPPIPGGKLPLAMIWKTSTKANIGTSPETHGHLVLSHRETGASVLLKLVPNDKMPLPEDESQPNSRPPEEDEQFSVGELWYEVDDNLLASHPGRWIAAVVSGSAISNVHAFQVMPPKTPSAPKRPEEIRKLTPEERARFQGGKLHPAVPSEGVAFRVVAGNDQEPPRLYGSFSFPVLPDEASVLRIGALVSGPEYGEMRRIPIEVPQAATQVVAGRRTGHFILDVRAALGNPRLKSFQLPERAYLTFVLRDWIGNPVPLAPSAPEAVNK